MRNLIPSSFTACSLLFALAAGKVKGTVSVFWQRPFPSSGTSPFLRTSTPHAVAGTARDDGSFMPNAAPELLFGLVLGAPRGREAG